MPRLVSIAFTPNDVGERKPSHRFARVVVDRAELQAGHGIAGDVKGTTSERQLNIMRSEDIVALQADGFHTAPGELGEQLVIAGLTADHIRDGTHLQIGPTAVIEIGKLREPCGRFETIQGITKETAVNRIGLMARVITSGPIKIGDAVGEPPASAGGFV